MRTHFYRLQRHTSSTHQIAGNTLVVSNMLKLFLLVATLMFSRVTTRISTANHAIIRNELYVHIGSPVVQKYRVVIINPDF